MPGADFDLGGPLPATKVKCIDYKGGKAVELTFQQDAFNVDISLLMKALQEKMLHGGHSS